MKFIKKIQRKSHQFLLGNDIQWERYARLAWHKFSIFGDIFDKNIPNLLCTTSLDLYFIISISAENADLHKYVVAKR